MEEFKYSEDTETFNKIVGPYKTDDTMWFSGLPYTAVAALLKRQMIDPNEEQNGPPLMKQFVDFLFVNQGFTCGGYVLNQCDGTEIVQDNGIIIESVEFKGEVTLELCLAFIQFAAVFDIIEASETRLYAWND